VSAFGFSFGGLAVLELARSGADLESVIVLSGVLDSPSDADAVKIKAPVLILHGSRDPIAPLDMVTQFASAMDATRRPYRVILFGGARHAFTNPAVGTSSEGPFRYSPTDGPAADEAARAFLMSHHAAL